MKGHTTTWVGATKTTTPTTPKKRAKLKRMSAKEKSKLLGRASCKEIVMKRSNGYCEARLAGCEVHGVHYHEVIPRSQGGSIVDPNNVRHLCWACHQWVHSHAKEARTLGLLKDNHNTK